jgi:uncharacterized protein YbbC (DUF1343 family)
MKVRVCQIIIFLTGIISTGYAQNIIVGAEKDNFYIDLLLNKNIGVVVNQTSIAHGKPLVEFLISREVNVTKIFTPEHGYKGIEDAGQLIDDSVDKNSGIPIISLYGDNKKPKAEQMTDLDIVVFDIQDVGARFYTYISTLHYVMEACAENNIKLLILDRPNPNGDYVDGPVLRNGFQSFVGMHRIPVVHGLTIGELAKMINGEYWLKDSLQCKMVVVRVGNYHHQYPYSLPVKPSPNLPDDLSVRLYPSLCFFEGTIMSLGRGTDFPFQVVGYPDPAFGSFKFIPQNKPGASTPKYMGKVCYGKDYRKESPPSTFTISELIEFYNKSGRDKDFFNDYFNKLAGNDELKAQIEAGFTEDEIRVSWVEELNDYKTLRRKYLLYPDSKK